MKTVSDPKVADELFVKRRRVANYGMMILFGLVALTTSDAFKSYPGWVSVAVLPLYLIPFILYIRSAHCTMCGGGIKADREGRTCHKCGHVFPPPEPLIRVTGGK